MVAQAQCLKKRQDSRFHSEAAGTVVHTDVRH